jgi:hypothetical protein
MQEQGGSIYKIPIPATIPLTNYRLKYHSGPIDAKALSSKTPEELVERILEVAKIMGLDLVRTTDFYKLKVYKNYPDFDTDTVSGAFFSDSNVSGVARTSIGSYERKHRSRVGNAISRFPFEVIQRIKYIGIFGMDYNRGYDGKHEVLKPKHITKDSPIKMYVMVHKIKNLDGLVTVDLKRSSGDIWEFKRLYHEFITNLDLGLIRE